MKAIISFLFVLVAGFMFGQRTVTSVTVDAAETNFSAAISQPKALQVKCVQLGGTSDGTIRLQGSVDGTNWVNLTSVDGVYDFFPNDTLTITSGASLIVRINDNQSIPFYRFSVTGTANDTTRVDISYIRDRIR